MGYTWEEGIQALQDLKLNNLVSYLLIGDIVNEMRDDMAKRMQEMRVKNPSLYRMMGGPGWWGKARAQLAYNLRCTGWHLSLLMRVSRTYPPELVPRERDAPNAFPETWGYLRAGLRFPDPWAAVQYALDHEWSYYEFMHAKLVDGQMVVLEREVDQTAHGVVECPQCGHHFKVRSRRFRTGTVRSELRRRDGDYHSAEDGVE